MFVDCGSAHLFAGAGAAVSGAVEAVASAAAAEYEEPGSLEVRPLCFTAPASLAGSVPSGAELQALQDRDQVWEGFL